MDDERFNLDEFPDTDMGSAGPEIPAMESLGVSPVEELLDVADVLEPLGTIEQMAPDDGLTEDDSCYDDTMIETVKGGATTLTDIDSLEFVAGAGITVVVAQDGAAENGDAEITITNTLGGSSSQIQHNLLSAMHPDTLTDDVVRGDVIVGNATPKWARLAKGSSGQVLKMLDGNDPGWGDTSDVANAAAIYVDKWVDVQASASTGDSVTIDSDDWRGRMVHCGVSYYIGTPANGRTNHWHRMSVESRMIGDNLTAGQIDVSDSIYDKIKVVVDCADSGKLKVWVSNETGLSQTQVRVWATATEQKTANDLSIS